MFKRFAAALIVLSIAITIGLVVNSTNSNARVTQQGPPARESIGQTNNSFGPPNVVRSYPVQVTTDSLPRLMDAGNQVTSFGTVNQPLNSSVEMKRLFRATYTLPSEAADSLTKLFAHKATALVECQTLEQDDVENELVQLVITAEPATQHSIRAFIAAVFPEANIAKYRSGNPLGKHDRGPQNNVASDQQLVSVKLPNMTCAGCVAAVQTALTSVDGISEIVLDPNKNCGSFMAPKELDVKATLDKLVDDGNQPIAGWSNHP